MRKLWALVSYMVLWSVNPSTSLGQISGAEISYSFPSFDRLHVKAVVYHSCVPFALNDTLYIETLDKNVSSNTEYLVPYTSVVDSSQQKICGRSCGWNSRKTTLKYEFPVDFWLNNKVDSISMSITPGYRPRGFAFIPNADSTILKISASIFRLSDQNSSYEFALPPPFYSIKDQDFMASPGLFHQGQGIGVYDSVICEAVAPTNHLGRDILYATNYSATKPFAFSSVSQLRKTFVVPQTGDQRFKPSQTGLSITKTRVSEYKNGIRIGYVEREQVLEVVSSSTARSHVLRGKGHSSPFNINNFNVDVCEDDTVVFSTSVTEGVVNDTDSVFLVTPHKWLTNKTSFSDTVDFQIPFNTQRVSTQPYRLFLSTYTNRCENGTYGSATYLINFKRRPKPQYGVNINQNAISFVASDTSRLKGTEFKWKFEGKSYKKDSVFTYVKYPGIYPYQLELVSPNGCTSTIRDTVKTTQFPYLKISPANSSQCEGRVLVDIQIENSLEHPQLLWSNGLVGASNLIDLDRDTVVEIKATFSNGFENYDTFRFHVLPKPFVAIDADSIHCEGNTTRAYLSNSMFPRDSFQELFWRIGDTIKIDNQDSISITGEKTIQLTARGKNGCINTDSLNIVFTETPNFPLLRRKICLNDSAEIQVSGDWDWKAEWLTILGNIITTNPTFKIAATNDTLILVRLHDKLNEVHCIWLDTLKIDTIPLPNIRRLEMPTPCSNGLPVFLNDTNFVDPVGGYFSIDDDERDILRNNKLYPKRLKIKNQVIHYHFTDSLTGCTGKASDTLQIHLAPRIKFTSQNLEPCVGTERISLIEAVTPDSGLWSGNGIVLLNDSFYYEPPEKGVISDSIYYAYDNGTCQSSSALFINVSLHAKPWFSTQSTIDGVDIIFRDSTACNSTSREWHFQKMRSDGKDSIRTEESIRLDYESPGFYPVFLVVEDSVRNIRDTSDTFIMRIVPNSIGEVSNWLSIFPSPSNQILYYKSDFDIQMISLYTIGGRESQRVSLSDPRIGSINTSSLPSGVYVIRISTKRGIFHSKHIVQH